jgi:hypothetical protein
MTVNTMKTLTLAIVAGLSLGVGAAIVQQGGSGLSVPARSFNQATQAPGSGIMESGSSEVDTIHPQSPGVHTGLLM